MGTGIAFADSKEYLSVPALMKEMNEKQRVALLTTLLSTLHENGGLGLFLQGTLERDQFRNYLRAALTNLGFKV